MCFITGSLSQHTFTDTEKEELSTFLTLLGDFYLLVFFNSSYGHDVIWICI